MELNKLFDLKKSYDISFSNNGKYLVSTSRNLILWDIENKKKVYSKDVLKNPSHTSISEDNNLIAIKNTKGQILIIERGSSNLLIDYQNAKEGEGSNVVFSKCGQFLIDGSWNGVISVRETLNKLKTFETQFQEEMITQVARNFDGDKYLFLHKQKITKKNKIGNDSYFNLIEWPFETKKIKRLQIGYNNIMAFDVSDDFSIIAAIVKETTFKLILYSTIKLETIAETEIEIGGSGFSVKIDSQSSSLACIEKGKVTFYQLPSLEENKAIELPYPSEIAFSKNGKHIALGSWENGIVLKKTPNVDNTAYNKSYI